MGSDHLRNPHSDRTNLVDSPRNEERHLCNSFLNCQAAIAEEKLHLDSIVAVRQGSARTLAGLVSPRRCPNLRNSGSPGDRSFKQQIRNKIEEAPVNWRTMPGRRLGAEKPSESVDAYISAAPQGVRPKLKEVRAAIREVAPMAAESISY